MARAAVHELAHSWRLPEPEAGVVCTTAFDHHLRQAWPIDRIGTAGDPKAEAARSWAREVRWEYAREEVATDELVAIWGFGRPKPESCDE